MLKLPVWTLGALIFLLIAILPIPFPRAYWLIATLLSLRTIPSPRKHILTPTKQAPK